jgi:hypothetical protein
MNKTIILIISIMISSSAFAEKNYTFYTTQSPLTSENILVKANEMEVQTHYEWLYLKDFPSKYKAVFQVSPEINENSIVLFVKSNFVVNQPISHFGKTKFRSVSFLSRLAGMQYRKTQEQDRYTLKFSPIIFKTIKAETKVLFPQDFNQYYIFEDLVNSSFMTHLKNYNFSSDLHQSDIISIFNDIGENKTEVHNISFAIITDTKMGGFVTGTKMKIMISKLKKQINIVVNTFNK